MGKQRKRVRIPAVNRVTASETHVQAEPQEAGVLWESEYLLQQYYSVVVDERLIETKWVSYFGDEPSPVRPQEVVARFKRMLRCIVADRKVLRAICEYLVLVEQDGRGDSLYVVEHYTKAKDFTDILVEQSHCFALEDKAWLLSIVSLCEGEEDFDLYLQVEGLRVAFDVRASGFHVGQHACAFVE